MMSFGPVKRRLMLFSLRFYGAKIVSELHLGLYNLVSLLVVVVFLAPADHKKL